MEKNSRIYIAGHLGMVGSAILRNLKSKGYNNFVLRSIDELDLLRQNNVEVFFEKEKPDYVILAAAKVGGIVANNIYRAQFIYENLMIQNNIVHAAYVSGVKKLLFLGSSCIYPKFAPQPMKEDHLLTGTLEPTNEPYAIAKIAGIKMCENYYRQYGCNFISVMPTNLYGPNDNYDLEKSHVLPALIRKMHLGKCLENNDWDAIRNDLNRRPVEGINGESDREAILNLLKMYGVEIIKETMPINDVAVSLWGTGNVFREFLHVDDMADASVFVLENIDMYNLYKNQGIGFLNIGSGIDFTIKEIAGIVKNIVGFKGGIIWDTNKPDGTPKKLMDSGLIEKLGWHAQITLSDGISSVYNAYKI